MDKEILGILASVLTMGVSLSYIYTMVRGRTRPHLYTIGIDAVLTTIVFFGVIAAGGGAGAWNLGISAFFLFIMTVLCFWYGTKDVTRLDAVFALSALFVIVPWFLTKDPTLSVVLTSIINLLSTVPAARKTWNDPYSEPWVIWAVNGSKHIFAIAALSVFSLATLTYPISIILMNAVFVAMVLWRRR